MSNDGDDVELVLNDSFKVRITFVARSRNQPLQKLEARSPEEVALAEYVLRLLREAEASSDDAEISFPAELIDVATRVGLLVAPHQQATEASPYRCDLDEDLLPFVPATILDPYATAAPGRLVRNRHIVVQTTGDLPQALVGKVAIDMALWGHLGNGFAPSVPVGFASETPIIWIENPTTSLFEPFWCGGTWGPALYAFIIDGKPLEELPDAARKMFWLANAIVAADPAPIGSPSRRATTTSQAYTVISALLSPLQLAAVRRHFRRLREAGWFELDRSQVVDQRDGAYCDVLSLFLQSLFTPVISALVAASIKPSYTWVFRYQPGAVLHRHKDRPQCRWNVSFCVDIEGDDPGTPWPFYLQDGSSSRAVQLGVGDAVVYSGSETPHWRDSLPAGKFVTVCLFHYVETGFSDALR